MSEDLEIARRYLEEPPAAAAPQDEIAEWFDGFWEPEGDYYPARKFPEARPCHGREEIVRFFTEYRAAWDYRLTVRDGLAVGDDRVVVRTRIETAGKRSNVTLEDDLYHCFWLRHRRFIRVEDHLTAKGALHALGLSDDAVEAAGLSE